MITINNIRQEIDLANYPKRYREIEIFLTLSEKNPNCDVVHYDDTGEIIAWRNDSQNIDTYRKEGPQ